MEHQLIFATGNSNKIREVREIVTDPDFTIQSMREAGFFADPEENGKTFEENAMIKANAVAELVRAQSPSPSLLSSSEGVITYVLSDDSGLVIDALDGAPGIYSARYLGRDTDYNYKMHHILDLLKDVPDEKRTARFVAAVAVIFPDGTSDVVRGTMEGRIGHKIAGSNGFGYDPFFFLPEYGKTSAEISPEEKNQISHRGKALRAVIRKVEAWKAEHTGIKI